MDIVESQAKHTQKKRKIALKVDPPYRTDIYRHKQTIFTEGGPTVHWDL